jgi:hypothetical protein
MIRLPRPLWIGVSALVLIVASIGMSVGLPIYRQHRVYRTIHRLGGTCEVKYAGPDWLRTFLGYQRTTIFEVISVVRLGGTDFGDGDMQVLCGLGTVEHVVLSNTRVTDIALFELRKLGPLKRVYLYGTRVTDAGIRPLTELKNLRVLDLSGTEITDEGLAQLHDIKSLERLYVDATYVTEEGVADLHRARPGLTIRK